MNKPGGKMRTTIRLTVVGVFLMGILLTATMAIGLQYYFGQTNAKQAATNLYTSISARIASEMASSGRINENIVELLESSGAMQDDMDTPERISNYARVLERNPLFYGVYLGHPNGDFFEVINLDNSTEAREQLQARAGDRWVVISVNGTDANRTRRYRYLDADLEPVWERQEPTDFDAATRPWYVSAMSAEGVHRTAPYNFSQLGLPGRTISRRIPGTDCVVAIDMTLAKLNQFLRDSKVTPHSDLFLYSPDGKIVASSMVQADAAEVSTPQAGLPHNDQPELETVDAIFTRIAQDPNLQGKLQETRIDGKKFLVYGSPPIGQNSSSLYVGIRAPTDKVMAPYLNRVKLSIVGTSGFMLLLLPLSWLFATPIVEPVRKLSAENDKVRRREYDQVSRIDSDVRELHELSESMVEMVKSIQVHEQEQRRLMDSFIELIAQAIDDKSAYTGGHCERVPELAIMLAESASESELPDFNNFKLDTEDQWREFRIAAWLHDCGKITTPEHIVDKGSKLETIYNRIHEVRMRFEVLWRDAEIDYWEQLAENPEQREQLTAELARKQDKLRDDFDFVAHCNVGGEQFDDNKRQRLGELARITWQRHFDDQVGLSPLEELRQSGTSRPLPATEQLLSDKPEHVIPRNRSTDYPPEFGINMEIPEHLYNQGEVYNLSVARGTLTAEDRFKINEHMISTIKMLESLPFPEELKNVPRYASTHHETMKGSGYPRRLPGEQLSTPERILAVADVFEALTASDRPYKKAKPVGVAIDIMHKMVLDNHLDRGCFELFLRSGVYRKYAEQFLSDDQLDALDITKYLSVA